MNCPKLQPPLGSLIIKLVPKASLSLILKAGHANKAQLLIAGQAGYPATLNDFSDAPPLLWALGNLSLLQKPMIALVGTRNASSLDKRMAKKLAADLGDGGYVIVSGLARGVDTSAHIAALPSGTIAV